MQSNVAKGMKIKKYQAHIFVYFSPFKSLVLTSFKQSIFNIVSLFSDVDDNPLRCDCKLRDFVEFAKNTQYGLDGISCQSPPDLNGTLLGNINPQDLDCDAGKIINPLGL